jgi:hypothetical protein
LKTCSRCKTQKSTQLFYKNGKSKDGYATQCKDCHRVVARQSIADKRIRLGGSFFTEESRKAHSQMVSKNIIVKRKNDPLFKLTDNTRKLVYVSLKSKNIVKSSKTTQILGCDFEFLRLYLEMQFAPDMSWDNFGEWHIDHKVPICVAKTTQDVHELNHFSNLQPLWGKYNILKKDMMPNQWKQYVKLNNINLGVKP